MGSLTVEVLDEVSRLIATQQEEFICCAVRFVAGTAAREEVEAMLLDIGVSLSGDWFSRVTNTATFRADESTQAIVKAGARLVVLQILKAQLEKRAAA